MTKYSFVWKELDEEEKARRKKLWGEGSNSIEAVKSEPGNCYMPKKWMSIAEKIYNFEVRPDDVWVVTYPKCGTTWTQEMLWQIVNGVDSEVATSPQHFFARTPFLEYECLYPDFLNPTKTDDPSVKEAFEKAAAASGEFKEQNYNCVFNSVDHAKNLKGPRVIKCHMPFSMLPPNLLDTCKVIYTCRNPLDTVVSYFHHEKHRTDKSKIRDDFQLFSEYFMKGKVLYGSYWYHLKDALTHRDHPNLKIIWYEDMKRDLQSVIRSVSKHIGYSLTDEKITELEGLLDINRFRKVAKAKAEARGEKPEETKSFKFYRKGQVGDWHNYFKGKEEERWMKWAKENLEGTGLDVTFEL